MPRISVVGASGTGKTTFARRVAALSGAPHVELDALWWGPKWTPVPLETFQERVRQVAGAEAWVIEGFYLDEAARPIVWPRADTIVWLDLPRRTAVTRALRRSAVRVVRRTELWGTNTQTPRTLTPRTIARFVRQWPTYGSRIEEALFSDRLEGKTIVRLGDDRAKDHWLSALTEENDS